MEAAPLVLVEQMVEAEEREALPSSEKMKSSEWETGEVGLAVQRTVEVGRWVRTRRKEEMSFGLRVVKPKLKRELLERRNMPSLSRRVLGGWKLCGGRRGSLGGVEAWEELVPLDAGRGGCWEDGNCAGDGAAAAEGGVGWRAEERATEERAMERAGWLNAAILHVAPRPEELFDESGSGKGADKGGGGGGSEGEPGWRAAQRKQQRAASGQRRRSGERRAAEMKDGERRMRRSRQ